MATIDYQDAKIEHLQELRLAKKYDDLFPEDVFCEYGRWHDHTCCSDCCGCADEYSQYLTLTAWLRG